MNISLISTNVQALLVATNKFVTVLPHPPTEDVNFAGYPAAAHYYVDAESNYATVSQNRRVLEYIVELYLVTNDETTPTTEFTEAYALIDSIMQTFDESIDLSSTTLSLSPACDIMRPTPSELTRITTNEGTGLMMVIRLFCEADVAFRS